MNNMNITKFKNTQAMTSYLASDIVSKLKNAIATKGQAVLLVSGGRSPIALFEQLNQTDIAWDKVIISLVDDRWVGPTHESSNENLVNQHLLINKAAKARFIGLVAQGDSAFDGIEQSIELIKDIKEIDVMILGMGEDGHTASIFPCCAQVEAAMSVDNHQRLIATQPTTAAFERVSFTLNEILAAKQVYLPLNGDNKVRVFEQAQQLEDLAKMPISAVIKQHTAFDVLISE